MNLDVLKQIATDQSGTVICFDPASIKAWGATITVQIQKIYSLLQDNGAAYETAVCSLVPIENLFKYSANNLCDASGEILSFLPESHWEYIQPDTLEDIIMKALVKHCQESGIAVDNTPPIYFSKGLQYIATEDNKFIFLNTANIYAEKSTLVIELRTIYPEIIDEIKYKIDILWFKTSLNQLLPRSSISYDCAGKKIHSESYKYDTSVEWFYIQPGTVYDAATQAVRRHCQAEGIPIKAAPKNLISLIYDMSQTDPVVSTIAAFLIIYLGIYIWERFSTLTVTAFIKSTFEYITTSLSLTW